MHRLTGIASGLSHFVVNAMRRCIETWELAGKVLRFFYSRAPALSRSVCARIAWVCARDTRVLDRCVGRQGERLYRGDV